MELLTAASWLHEHASKIEEALRRSVIAGSDKSAEPKDA